MRRTNLPVAALMLMIAGPVLAATVERIDIPRGLIFLDVGSDESGNYPLNSPVIVTPVKLNLKINSTVSSQQGKELVLYSREDFSQLTYYNEVKLSSPVSNGSGGQASGEQNRQSRRKASHWSLSTGFGRGDVDYLLAPQYEFYGTLKYHFNLPLSVGPRVSYQIADGNGLPNRFAQKNLLLGLEMMSWSPTAKFGPYVGLRYDFVSQGSMTIAGTDGAGTSTYVYSTLGLSYFGGLAYRYNSLFSITGGFETGDRTTNLPPNELFSPPSPTSKKDEYNYRSKSMVLGLLVTL